MTTATVKADTLQLFLLFFYLFNNQIVVNKLLKFQLFKKNLQIIFIINNNGSLWIETVIIPLLRAMNFFTRFTKNWSAKIQIVKNFNI